MTAAAILNRAASIMVDRAAQYNQPGGERSMARTVAAFNAVTGRDLSVSEGWLFMVQLKLVRSQTATGFSPIEAASRTKKAARPATDPTAPLVPRASRSPTLPVTLCPKFLVQLRRSTRCLLALAKKKFVTC